MIILYQRLHQDQYLSRGNMKNHCFIQKGVGKLQ